MTLNLTDIMAQEDRYTSGAYAKRPLALVRGEGCYVQDAEGNTCLDLTAGLGVAALGHSHPAVAAAIQQQATTLLTCPEAFYNDQRARFYGLLASVLPGDLNRFFLCNSGTEAIEGALKVARLLTNRTGIVAARRGFHGRTLGSLSLTWKSRYREPFQVWQPAVTHIPYNDIEALAEAITEDTAAVVIEAIQGEGGVHPADSTYMQALRQRCDETGALLIIDEIQTGFGRTGRWFAFEHSRIIPDIVALGKAIASGVPMGAVAWRESLGMIPTSTHGSTFGGNPLACAAAITTITTLQEQNLSAHAAELGDWFMNAVRERQFPAVREVRGYGLMIGIELRGRVMPILQQLQARGIIALPAGLNVLRLLPPLIITREQLEQVLAAFEEVLR
ncbi:MAG: aspartate aminotransferase family protein [Chloroflexi bacterium]|nr:MAG: aspartate aminotransferase family protein [Chloroflexota bacterium]